MSTTGLQGHEFKLYKSAFSTNIGKFSFSNRIIDDWNSFPLHVVSSNAVNIFIYVWIDIIALSGV